TGIPSYWTGDVRLGWRPHRRWDLSIVGRNLFYDRQEEFFPTTISSQRAAIERSVFAKVTVQF
ncbi:MAG: hypothetical protein ACK4UN_07880, partial [Limisphaerales bacterium]